MTYASFLLTFIVPPIALLAGLVALRARSGRRHGSSSTPAPWVSPALVAALLVVAMLYTTPWDNHLIAGHVWFYDRARIAGITLGWIPVEELLFFPLQTLLVALWYAWLAPFVAPVVPATGAAGGFAAGRSPRMQLASVIAVGFLWLVAVAVLLAGWRPGTYLGWELAWALPPVILLLAAGADVVWRAHRLLVAVIVPALLYLSTADAVAIHVGIWAIDPHHSTGLLIGGTLPLEELVFFLLTTTLIALGLALGGSAVVRKRLLGALSRAVLASPWRPAQRQSGQT